MGAGGGSRGRPAQWAWRCGRGPGGRRGCGRGGGLTCALSAYRGHHHWVPVTRRLFGGQIVGQALVAAARAVDAELQAHSLHCYFVRAGE